MLQAQAQASGELGSSFVWMVPARTVVRVEVVRDVGRAPGPRAERVELVLRLRHVRSEEGECSERWHAVAGVGVDRVVSLVDLDGAEPVGGGGLGGEGVVLA